AWLLRRHEARRLRERAGQEAQLLSQPARAGKGDGVASAMRLLRDAASKRLPEVYKNFKRTFCHPAARPCTCSLRVNPAAQNPVQCLLHHLCEGALSWYPTSFSTRSC